MLATKENIGQLDRRITIQERTTTKDDYNQDVVTWSTFATVWAKIQENIGGESYQADQLTASRFDHFTIRYAAVTETMRILYNDRFYDIRSIQKPDRNRYLVIKAELLDET